MLGGAVVRIQTQAVSLAPPVHVCVVGVNFCDANTGAGLALPLETPGEDGPERTEGGGGDSYSYGKVHFPRDS